MKLAVLPLMREPGVVVGTAAALVVPSYTFVSVAAVTVIGRFATSSEPLAAMVVSPAAETVKLLVVLMAFVVLVVVKVSWLVAELPLSVTEVGEKAPVTPEGRAVSDRLTVRFPLPFAPTVTTYVAVVPVPYEAAPLWGPTVTVFRFDAATYGPTNGPPAPDGLNPPARLQWSRCLPGHD